MTVLETAKDQLVKLAGGPVQSPKDSAKADLCVPCFAMAKGKNPADVAKALCQKKPPSLFSRLEEDGPYLNAFFSDAFYAQALAETAEQNFGRKKKGKTWVLEYSQPNPGKPMHLGHIRSTIVGDVLSNCLAFCGNTVHRLNYLNDRGAHIAELIVALEEFRNLPKVRDEKDLLAYYVKIKAEIASNAELKEKTRNVLEHLKDHRAELAKIREMSLSAFNRNYKRLGVRFDFFPLESELEDESRARVKEALEKGLAKKEPDGTTIAFLEPAGLPNTVLLRSNDTPVYLTSDLALADWKMKKYGFDESLVITAAEQNLHFRQLQALLAGMGRTYAPHYGHIGFGLIRLSDGKLSTRLGRVVLLEDVLEQTVKAAENELRARKGLADAPQDQSGHAIENMESKTAAAAKIQDYSEAEIRAVSEAVGVAALKFAVLRTRLEKDITFDPAAETRFEGDTAAYVQYAHVRCHGILEKFSVQTATENPSQGQNARAKSGSSPKTKSVASAKPAKAKKSALRSDPAESPALPPLPKKMELNQAERELLNVLSAFSETVAATAEKKQPHVLCEYALKVAKAFTHFYAAAPVLTASEALKAQRIHIVFSTKNVLGLTLGLLGIMALERM